MNISPRENRINLMTDDFLTTFNVPYNIQLFAENDIGEGAGSNPIVFTRIPGEYIGTSTSGFVNQLYHRVVDTLYHIPGNLVIVLIWRLF